MGKIIIKNVVKREPGFLYYIDGLGNVCKAEMARKKTKSKATVKVKKKKK